MQLIEMYAPRFRRSLVIRLYIFIITSRDLVQRALLLDPKPANDTLPMESA